MGDDIELTDLPHFRSETERDAGLASAVSRFCGRLLAAFQESRLDDATRSGLLHCSTRALLCPECGPGNLDPARLIQAYALVHLLGCHDCVGRYTREALAQGFTQDQLQSVLALVSGLQSTATLLHAHSVEPSRPRRSEL